MLPEELSNELCSLQPHKVRLAHSVIVEFMPNGNIVDYKISESVIKSAHRFTYAEVQEIIEGRKDKYSELVLNLHKFAVLIRDARFRNGGVDFQSVEVKFRLDETNNPVEAVLRTTTSATSLVEEFMLAANKIVAGHALVLSKKYGIKPPLPFIYRVHDEPQHDKLTDILTFVKMLQPSLHIKGRSSKQINDFVRQFNELPEKTVVHQLLLRTMAKAEYDTKNIGHYGLGFDNYTHFTSPIRRYPDLLVHRLIKEYSKAKPAKHRIKTLIDKLDNAASHSTQQERLAMEAERASTKLMQTAMAKKYIGKVLEGTVSGVIHFGLFVLIDDFYGDGLLHIRDLHDDYYYFDERNYRFVGKHTKKVIQLGKRLKVRIYKVDLESRKVDLEFVELLN
jgi:ribonuclease R